MRVVVETWNEQPVVRIPAAALESAGFRAGDTLDIQAEIGRLVIGPEPPSLEALLAHVTPENRHGLLWTDPT